MQTLDHPGSTNLVMMQTLDHPWINQSSNYAEFETPEFSFLAVCVDFNLRNQKTKQNVKKHIYYYFLAKLPDPMKLGFLKIL